MYCQGWIRSALAGTVATWYVRGSTLLTREEFPQMESSDLFSHPADTTDFVYETDAGPVGHPFFSGLAEADPPVPASS